MQILIYTAGNINYGGRITDDWDRRCVLTILEDYYNVNVVSEGHRFDKTRIYYQLPKDATFQDYVDYIKTLPLNDDPSLFGMHMNADISFAQAETYSCLNTLLALQSGEKTDAESSIENIVINTAEEILSTLPEPFDLSIIEERYPICYEESFNTVLLQEAKRYNGLLTLLKLSLEDLLKALQGLVVMAEHLEKMTTDLSNNKVPEAWQKIGFASLKPLGSWFIELQERIEFMNNWYQNGIPVAFWFSGFYFPQAFLTATLQNFVRKQLVSIDVIDFSFQVLSIIPEVRPNNGCIVYGLFLEGCRWGGDYLVESNPKELYTEMPPIFLLPEKNHRVKMNEIYLCPVYKTLTRAGTLSTTGHSTNFVLAMELPSQNTQAHWIKRGVALICSLDY